MSGALQIDPYPEITAALDAGLVLPPETETPVAPEPAVRPASTDQASELRRLVAGTEAGSSARILASPVQSRSVRADAAPVIAIASGKGGVGKSTLALNLGIAAGRPATLVDLDLGTANLDVLCGLSPATRLDTAIVGSDCPDLSRLIVRTRFGFGLIPGAAGIAHAAALDPESRRSLFDAVRALGSPGELTIADLGAGIGPSVIEPVAASDLGVIVTTPDPAAVADAYAIIKCVVRHRGDPRPLRMGLVVTMAESRSVGRETHARIDRVCRRFLGGALPLLGVIRRDERVVQATRRREPLLARRGGGPAQRDLRSVSALIGMLAPRAGRDPGPGPRL